MKYGLTQREQDTLRAIVAYQDAHDGIAPAYHDLMKSLDLSKSNIHRLVQQLQRKGWLDCLPHKPRSMRVVNGPPSDTGNLENYIEAEYMAAKFVRDCIDEGYSKEALITAMGLAMPEEPTADQVCWGMALIYAWNYRAGIQPPLKPVEDRLVGVG